MYKKILPILLSVMMILSLSFTASAADVAADGETETSSVTSTEILIPIENVNGASSPGYFPDGIVPPSEIGLQAIINADSRTRVNPTTAEPYKSTVYLQANFPDGTQLIGSGFMIGPSAIATAGHCVYNGQKATSVTVIPAKSGSTYPYGSTTVTTASKIIVSPKYLTSGGVNNDWAIVELNDPLGNQTGWLGLRWQTASYNDTLVYNTGYPSAATTSGQSANRYMYVGTGYIKESMTYTLKGNWDATEGNSGGPVFAYYSDTGYTAIGILTNGSNPSTDGSSYPTAHTIATRITKEMYDLFVTYR